MELVEGWSADVDLHLVDEAAGSAYNLTGATVTLVIKNKNGTALTGTNSIPSPATQGIVRWTPTPAEILASVSPLYLHVKVTVSAKDTYVPQGLAHVINVRAVAGP